MTQINPITFAELLDLANADGVRLLSDCELTIRQRRPTGPIDPATRKRAVGVGAQTAAGVPAVRASDRTERENGRALLRVREWLVDPAAVGFMPSREGEVVDSDGPGVWRIADVVLQQAGRELRIVGERTG